MATLTKVYTKDWTEDSVWIINTPSALAQEALFYVQEIGMFKCLPQYYTEHENIASFLVLFILSGSCEYHYQDKTHRLAQGDLIFADCMEYHAIQPDGNRKWDMIWVQFNGITAPSYYKQFAKQNKPAMRVGKDGDVHRCLSQLLTTNQNKSIYSELISSKLITDLLTEILVGAGAAFSSEAYMPEFVQTAVKDIDTHFKENLSLDYFARTLSISKYHFLKEFKKYTGFTPNDYLRMTRINHAKKLLKFTDMSVYEVAEKTGFQSPGYFINTFRKMTGMTPANFRVQGSLGMLEN